MVSLSEKKSLTVTQRDKFCVLSTVLGQAKGWVFSS